MNDLISRAALLDEFLSLCGPQTGDGWDNIGVRSLIIRQKTVDAAPVKHGRWYDKGSLSCRCSCCGCKSNKEYDYCPNCGAKMGKTDV